MNFGNNNALQQYRQVGTHTEVDGASPHRLIQLLMEGGLEKIRIAKMQMECGNVAEKASHISWAIAIIGGLQDSLDMEKGGEISENLDKLYDYMQYCLTVANMENDPAILDEIHGLLNEIKEAWDGVPEILRGLQEQNVATGS